MFVIASWVTSGSIAQANDAQTLTWQDGTRYVGSVRSNQMHGQGTIYWQDGPVMSEISRIMNGKVPA